jgi:hypothetical protein
MMLASQYGTVATVREVYSLDQQCFARDNEVGDYMSLQQPAKYRLMTLADQPLTKMSHSMGAADIVSRDAEEGQTLALSGMAKREKGTIRSISMCATQLEVKILLGNWLHTVGMSVMMVASMSHEDATATALLFARC